MFWAGFLTADFVFKTNIVIFDLCDKTVKRLNGFTETRLIEIALESSLEMLKLILLIDSEIDMYQWWTSDGLYKQVLREDYKIKIQALTDHRSKILQRIEKSQQEPRHIINLIKNPNSFFRALKKGDLQTIQYVHQSLALPDNFTDLLLSACPQCAMHHFQF